MNRPCIDHGKRSTAPGGYAGCYKYGKQRRLHRVVWAEHNGVHPDSIPSHMVVMHTCDNPRCVEPTHLKLSTQQDNMDDKVAKGRHRCGVGENNGNAVLTMQVAREIRAAYIPRDKGCGQRALARKYNVGQMTIHDIIHNITWKEQ